MSIEGSPEVVLENNKQEQSPEDILRQLAEYTGEYMSGPIEAVASGTFPGGVKLKIDKGNIVLVRKAYDEYHLIKSGKSATPEEMRDSSLFTGGSSRAGAVHTSADVENWNVRDQQYKIKGEFEIPIDDFLKLASKRQIMLGNLGEAEIIISGDEAKKYLKKITQCAT